MSPQKLHFLGRPKIITPVPRRAAQYIRMSTNHQRYSIENQKDAIAQYAILHEIEVVRTYLDAGRSGLMFETREALPRLISDVRSCITNLEHGRFNASRAVMRKIAMAINVPLAFLIDLYGR